MKKILPFLILFTTINFALAQDCSQFFISKYMRGKGNTKCIELYNPTSNPINLQGYFMSRLSASGSTGAIAAINNLPVTQLSPNTLALSGTIAPFSTFLIVNGQTTTAGTSPASDPNLRALANLLDLDYSAPGTGAGKPTYFKGNDPVFIKDSLGNIVDLFGEGGVNVTTAWSSISPYRGGVGMGAWITNKYILVRKPTVKKGVIANPTDFNPLGEYDSLPGLYAPNNTNADSALFYGNFGAHTCDCFLLATSIKKNGNDVVSVSPNPATNFVTIKSSSTIKEILVYNLIGNLVSKQNNISNNQYILNTEEFSNGIYLINVVTTNGNVIVHKVSINK